jgi:hypothetical protein
MALILFVIIAISAMIICLILWWQMTTNEVPDIEDINRMEKDILPCFKCGAIPVMKPQLDDACSRIWVVSCGNCEDMSVSSTSVVDAAHAWIAKNRTPPEDSKEMNTQ